jgi:hypothetical protein
MRKTYSPNANLELTKTLGSRNPSAQQGPDYALIEIPENVFYLLGVRTAMQFPVKQK